jgi:hypothetical protein
MAFILEALDAFLQEHRRCGLLDAGVTENYVWMICDCGARLSHPTRREPEDYLRHAAE